MTPVQRQTPLAKAAVAALFVSVFATGAAFAQYKVVGPDGKVTYTDRPEPNRGAKVQPVATSAGSSNGADLSSLPYELRQVAQRYPVTLYTSSGCGPCDAARQSLRQRGVPFTERTVNNTEDTAALQRATGKTDLPSATIGSQALNGFNADDWASYLDAAGYPKQSRLPANYVERPATPLTERAAPAPAPAARRAPSPSPSPAPEPSTAPPGFKF